MNILSVLRENFEAVEPIFERDILEMGYSIVDIDETLKENIFEKVNVDITGFDFGNVYTLVEYSELFDTYFKCECVTLDVIELFFTGRRNKFGYRCGFSALNLIGLSNQVCASREVESVLVNEDIVIGLCNCEIKVKPIRNNYNSDMVLYYMFANAIDSYKNYFDCNLAFVKKLVIEEFKLDCNILYNYLTNKEVFYEIFK